MSYRLVGGTLEGLPVGWLAAAPLEWAVGAPVGWAVGAPVGWDVAPLDSALVGWVVAWELAWDGRLVGLPAPDSLAEGDGLPQPDRAASATAWPCAFGLADSLGLVFATEET